MAIITSDMAEEAGHQLTLCFETRVCEIVGFGFGLSYTKFGFLSVVNISSLKISQVYITLKSFFFSFFFLAELPMLGLDESRH